MVERSGGAGRITAVLGPTNTGKTHYAIERMLGHRTGVIGLPLRLLAREVYDRIVAARGPSVVALLTGEERIVPPRAAYWVATTEAMPLGVGADFVAIDEIQLCADPERGHVFTDRLLHARGLVETMFLGAETMRPRIAELVPEARFIQRERFSTLSWTGGRKLSRLKPRSAVVAFSVDEVYAIAELIRRQRGGAAVVLGALSPRTRNAQVALYQNGDVDFLVATDAIGMGLNLDIDHVAFAGTAKFDGRRVRRLSPAELAQIAGRAGRHTRPGTFGTTGDAAAMEPETVAAIEDSRFAPVRVLQWRNRALDFASPEALIASLERNPDRPTLARARDSDDLIALRSLATDREVAARAAPGAGVKLLWEVCQIPDFRGISRGDHHAILRRIHGFLSDIGRIPDHWLAGQLRRIDRTDGDIDTLSKRLSYVRTWTYVAQRRNWVEDAEHWRGETRALEDRLSDALHAALTRRFVDRRTSVLMRRLKQKERLVAEINDKGEVTVEGQFVGRLEGFRFIADESAQGEEARTLRAAAAAALAPQFRLQADRFYNAPDTEMDVTEQGGLMWGEHAVGRLEPGGELLAPRIRVFVDDEAGAEVAERVERRLRHFLERRIAAQFAPLVALRDDPAITGIARGVAFRLYEGLGVLDRAEVAEEVRGIDQEMRAHFRRHGVRFGQYTLFMPALLKPAPTRLRLLLTALADRAEEFPSAPPPGLVTIPAEGRGEVELLRAGYRAAGARAIRIDMLERLADLLRGVDQRAGFSASADMLSITGLTHAQFAELMAGLGFEVETRQEVPQPVAAPAEAAEGGTPEQTGEKAESDEAAAADVAADTAESPAEAAPPDDAPRADAAAQDGADASAEGAAGAGVGEVAEQPEPVTVYIFRRARRPRRAAPDSGAATAGREARKGAPRRGKPGRKGAKGGKPGKGRDGDGPRVVSAGPRKPRKETIDPDNPFAALLALKNDA